MTRPSLARARLAAAALLALPWALAANAGEALYEWSDAEGVIRYTTQRERIPAARREAAMPVLRADPVGLAIRIAELESRIAADEAAIAEWLGDSDGSLGRGDLGEISERLPRLQAELRTLRARRAASGPADAR